MNRTWERVNRALYKNRFVVARRLSQGVILFLFFGGSAFGWSVLRGTLSESKLLNTLPLADPFAVLQVIATGSPVRMETLIGAGVITLFFGLLAGRAFCSWVCPMNMVTEAAGWLGTRLGLRPEEERALRFSRSVRYWALGLSIVLSAITGVAAFEWVNPISMLVRGLLFGIGLGWLAVLAVFVFDAFLVRGGFCGRICPLGAFYAIITRFSMLRVRHDEERCTRCMKCVEVCPEQQVLGIVGRKSGPVSSGECSNCGRCIDVCDDHAMAFTVRRFAEKR
jgi:ferredoxin-type protein NapH